MSTLHGWAIVAFLALCAVATTHITAQGRPAKIVLESAAFEHGDSIPVDHTADGRNVSPPLSWRGLPEGTSEIAVILDDPDAPTPEPFVHWVIYRIPGNATGLPEAIPPGSAVNIPGLAGATQGMTGFGTFRQQGDSPVQAGYRGPAPPPGKPHQYRFRVYALNAPLAANQGLDTIGLLEAMKGTVIGEGELVGHYERRPPP